MMTVKHDTPKTLRSKLESFDLPFVAIIGIEEAVNAFDKYDKLPQASKDTMQVLADMHNLFFTFAQKGRKMILSGIGIPSLRDVYLFPDNRLDDSQRFLKNATEYLLFPHADNKLEKWDKPPKCPSCEGKGWIWLSKGKQTDCPNCQ